jgi:hypothetical protein
MRYRGTLRVSALGLGICVLLLAVEPRKSAQDYPAHQESVTADIGVDYQVHSYSAEGQMYFTKDYLVCEIAVYPKIPMELTGSSFALRLNHSKNAIGEASPELVAASLKDSDWTQRPQVEPGAGVGDGEITIGRPAATGRFPGDPSAGRTQPRLPPAPEDPHAVGKTVKDASQLALNTALPRGRIAAPVAGNVYFEYSGNLKKIKNITLLVHTAAGDLEVPIR